MKRIYGLLLVCMVAGFCVGCDSTKEDEVSPGGQAMPAEQQQQMDAYGKAATQSQPNHQ